MHRLVLCLAVVVAALVAAPAALADGPMFVTQDGAGVAHGSLRYVAANTTSGRGTDLVEVSARDHSVGPALRIPGAWGLPYTAAGAEGLSHDGRTLVLGRAGIGISSPSRFLIVDPQHLRVVRTIALDGYFTYDALSPDASRLYLIQYTHGRSQDTSRYIVRAYDMRTNRLLPGKIAARSEDDEEETMAGYAVTRATSAGGRWVYTLYQKPSGEPFVHALDTVRGVAYCIDLPANGGLSNVVLSLRDRDRTLVADWRSGRPWLRVAVGTWRISYPGGGLPWVWVGAGSGGAAGVGQQAGHELGLA